MANLPAVKEFQKQFNCKVKMFLPGFIREIAENLYPEIEQVHIVTCDYYATFYMVAGMGDFLSFIADTRTIPLKKAKRA